MFSDFFTYSHVAGLLSGVAGFIFFGWMIFRTRSWYILKYFLWRVFHGKSGITDPVIKRYLGEQSSLMLFRFVAVDAETNQDAQELIQWSKDKNISLETVGRAGGYFNPKKRCVSEKMARSLTFFRRAYASLSIFVIVLMLPTLLTFATSRAILAFKTSDQWFLLGNDNAKAIFAWNAEEFDRSQCSQPNLGDVAKAGFAQNAAISICKFWSDQKTSAYIETTVHRQRVAGAWLLLILGLFSFKLWRDSGQARAAQKVHERLSASSAQKIEALANE
ncbi:DUF6216 family protein [Dyella sp. GSA-30]|uniref:DUF6216 family protein n=1 Tax=Dyella sp. GSA-30 TaxID=2994496 RepID=UPI00248F8E99|nr:DUF6216 family protein [Dyella sp. GSA-30]